MYFHNQWLLADLEGRGLSYFIKYYAFPDVLVKLPHHGAFESVLTKQLIKIINPKYGIISVGDNPYGHPKKQTLAILQKYGIKTYRTDQLGSIVVLVSRKGDIYLVPLNHWWVYALQYIM